MGKKRSRVGKWLDQRGISQEWVRAKSKVGRTTISKVCSDDKYIPNGNNVLKIIKALREIDPNVSANKFWDI
jgi:predicted transcriptional regulator